MTFKVYTHVKYGYYGKYYKNLFHLALIIWVMCKTNQIMKKTHFHLYLSENTFPTSEKDNLHAALAACIYTIYTL